MGNLVRLSVGRSRRGAVRLRLDVTRPGGRSPSPITDSDFPFL